MTRLLDLSAFQHGVFVETGTGRGDRVLDAIRLGFPVIYSIELFEDVFSAAYETVQQALPSLPTHSSVTLCHGDSHTSLQSLCETAKASLIDAKSGIITFWLDARPARHADGLVSAGSPAYPLLSELAVIRGAFRGALLAPVILVNGITEQLAGLRMQDPAASLTTVQAAILAIDPDYRFEIVRFQSGGAEPADEAEDVLAAFPAWFVDAHG